MIIKKIIKKLFRFISLIIVKALNKFGFGRYFLEQINKNIINQKLSISHNKVSLSFFTPNRINLFRIKTFSEKEPETLEWIDNFKNESVFWDVGSNIGIYSCYAAAKRKCKTYAFESSVFNLEFLAKNIYENNLNEIITIIPLPLTDKLKETHFNMSSITSGGAMSSFGEEYKSDGKKLNKIFSYKTLGLSMDEYVNYLKIQPPNYIKIDVDGIEHLILSGGKSILSKVKEVLVEVDEEFEKQIKQVRFILEASGLKFISKHQSILIKKANQQNKTYNQIWKRN